MDKMNYEIEWRDRHIWIDGTYLCIQWTPRLDFIHDSAANAHTHTYATQARSTAKLIRSHSICLNKNKSKYNGLWVPVCPRNNEINTNSNRCYFMDLMRATKICSIIDYVQIEICVERHDLAEQMTKFITTLIGFIVWKICSEKKTRNSLSRNHCEFLLTTHDMPAYWPIAPGHVTGHVTSRCIRMYESLARACATNKWNKKKLQLFFFSFSIFPKNKTKRESSGWLSWRMEWTSVCSGCDTCETMATKLNLTLNLQFLK